MNGLLLRFLAYFGAGGAPATLKLHPGLNVICGASETGKSFIADSIDFMLGQENPVRDIPERAGYDRMRLAIESSNWPPLTLDRSVEGGNYRAYEEMQFFGSPLTQPKTLRYKHSAARKDTVSFELLRRANLDGRYIRKNKSGDTRTLSFRDLARLCVVTEAEIQKRGSPLLTGQYVSATAEYAIFKLLLTGNDDSALVAVKQPQGRRDQQSGKIELLDQMIEELKADLNEEGVVEHELNDQLERLDASITQQNEALESVQKALNTLLEQRGVAATELTKRKARLAEIKELAERFYLLDQHYKTDLNRLEAISESGSLFVHLDRTPCPLCGAMPDDQHLYSDCDGNTEAVVQAADAELLKIKRLRRELDETVGSLRAEWNELNDSLAKFQDEYDSCNAEINDIATPTVVDERTSYRKLVSEQAEVRTTLEKFQRLHRLTEQRMNLEDDDEDTSDTSRQSGTQISKSILDEFSETIEQILQEWHFPNASRVFFDEGKRDFQIAGKDRGSTGKGLRAITHAAFSIGLMEFCRERGLPHPGFVVLDSPLLAYWKPEGEEDNLSGTDLDEMFYRYLLGLHEDNQVIILENKHPPDFVAEEGHITVFTKNPHQGRYGFFPHQG
jgi:predicted nuclease with TOPRIM domain